MTSIEITVIICTSYFSYAPVHCVEAEVITFLPSLSESIKDLMDDLTKEDDKSKDGEFCLTHSVPAASSYLEHGILPIKCET